MEQAIRLYKERIKAMGYLSPSTNEDTQVWPTRSDACIRDKNPLDLSRHPLKCFFGVSSLFTQCSVHSFG